MKTMIIQKYQSMLLIWHSSSLQDPFEREVSGPPKVHTSRSPVIQVMAIQLHPPPVLASRALFETDVSRN